MLLIYPRIFNRSAFITAFMYLNSKRVLLIFTTTAIVNYWAFSYLWANIGSIVSFWWAIILYHTTLDIGKYKIKHNALVTISYFSPSLYVYFCINIFKHERLMQHLNEYKYLSILPMYWTALIIIRKSELITTKALLFSIYAWHWVQLVLVYNARRI